MIYWALIVVGFVVPIFVGAVCGARLSYGACVLIGAGLLGVMLGMPIVVLEYLPKGLVPWLEDMSASVGIVALFGNSLIIGEYCAGVQLGRKRRRDLELAAGARTAELQENLQ